MIVAFHQQMLYWDFVCDLFPQNNNFGFLSHLSNLIDVKNAQSVALEAGENIFSLYLFK